MELTRPALLRAFGCDTPFLHFRFIKAFFLPFSITNKNNRPSKQALIRVLSPSKSAANTNTALQKQLLPQCLTEEKGVKGKEKSSNKKLLPALYVLFVKSMVICVYLKFHQ